MARKPGMDRMGGKSSTALTIGNLSPRNHSLDKQALPPLPFFPNPLWIRSLSDSVFQTNLPPSVGPSSKIFPESTRWMDFSKEKRIPQEGEISGWPTPHVRDKMQIPRFHNLTSGRVLIARAKTLERSN